MFKLFSKIFKDPNEKLINTFAPIIEKINGLEPEVSKFSDDKIKSKASELRAGFTDKTEEEEEKELERILPLAFALVREAGKRVLKQRHYDVQLIGGIVLHRGMIAEMKTGEGKTLVATLPLYLNALTGRGVQLITVNDYLSTVGAGWMAPVYHFLGLTVGVIVHDSAFIYDPEYVDENQYDERLSHFRAIERREAYACDIIYGTNNEFGFDYLRDNMAPSLDRMVQRELNYVIVDEIDSILIDEARTPLIISAPAEDSTDKYFKFAQLVKRLKEDEDYNVDEKMRASTLTEDGITKMEKWLGVENIYTTKGIREVHHIEQALKAHALFKYDRDYVVKDGEVIIVDEFTGRLMHGRRYSEGLHQAIEAKEGVKVQKESLTLASITFQNYFRMYKKLSGMTGTAVTEAEEFAKIYNLNTTIIPTNRPNVRKDLNDLIYSREEGKFLAVIKDVKERSTKGQPILIGTISIEKNELLLDMMERNGLHPQILNAKNHETEAKIIARAGTEGAITIATNMAGRGVDIMLGGAEPAKNTPEHEAWQKEHIKIKDCGGLHVIGTERHESRRIDNQLRGRAARQGDPGSSQFFVSTEDDLMRIFGGDRMRSIMATLKVPEDMPIENRIISKSIESAQKKVEGNNFDIRKHLVEYDDVANKHREAIYKKRRNVLELLKPDQENKEESNNELSDIVLRMIENEIEQVVSFHTAGENIENWNLEEIFQVTSTIFPVQAGEKDKLGDIARGDHKLDKAKARTAIIEHLTGLMKDLYNNIKQKAKEAQVKWEEIEKAVLIRSIDTLWIEHLEAMSSVRQGIGLRGYGQRDPLIEYKKEAYRLFNELNNLIQKEVAYSIFKVSSFQTTQEAGISAPTMLDQAKIFSAPAKTMTDKTSGLAGLKPAGNARGQASNEAKSVNIIQPKLRDSSGKKVGRNDPCPCGSGKKFKKCCGK